MELPAHPGLDTGGWAPLPDGVHEGLDFVCYTVSGGKRQKSEEEGEEVKTGKLRWESSKQCVCPEWVFRAVVAETLVSQLEQGRGREEPCHPWVGSGPADSCAASVGVRRGHSMQWVGWAVRVLLLRAEASIGHAGHPHSRSALNLSRSWKNRPSLCDLSGGSDGKESACNAGDWVWSLGWEDPLEKGMATHSVGEPRDYAYTLCVAMS